MRSETFETWLADRKPMAREQGLLRIGESIGDWKVLAVLGKGGNAEVYRVQHLQSAGYAAMKVLISGEERLRERFRREEELLRRQTAACFARFIDSGEWHGHPYFVMEELEAIELPKGDPGLTEFVLAVGEAVASLHAEGYVHRDLMPGNIMRRSDGTYVLVDLGLARRMETGNKDLLPHESLSIVDGDKVGVGTLGFSAPEQFTVGMADETADVHGIGMLIYTCFDGKPPRRWDQIVEKATSSIPSQRFASVRELMQGMAAASAVRPPLVKLLLAVAYLPLVSGLIWMVARSVYAHYHYGAGVHQISYFVGQMIAYGAFASILPVGLTFRQSWARWLTIAVGGVFASYLAASIWLENGVQTLNVYALGAVCLWFCPTIIAAILLMIPSVARWYGR